jgi:hypothetical protein
LNILITGAGYLILLFSVIKLSFIDIPLLSFLFSVIAIIILIIFLKGQTKNPETQTMFTFVSLGLKFLLELLLALVWFIFAKKTSLPSVIIFFVLYLTLTLFSLLIIMKTLKNKSL